jgi:hypothetical protein
MCNQEAKPWQGAPEDIMTPSRLGSRRVGFVSHLQGTTSKANLIALMLRNARGVAAMTACIKREGVMIRFQVSSYTAISRHSCGLPSRTRQRPTRKRLQYERTALE